LQGSAVTYGVVVVVVVVVVVSGVVVVVVVELVGAGLLLVGWVLGVRIGAGSGVVLVGVVLVVVGIVVVVGVDTVGLPAPVEVDAGGGAVACGVARGTGAGGTEARVVGDENGNDEGDDEDESDVERGDESRLRAASTAAAERAVRRALLAPALSLCARVAADDERRGPLPAMAPLARAAGCVLGVLGDACVGVLAATATDATRLAAKAPASAECSDRRDSVRGELSTIDEKAEMSRSE
jgi:hypothetical protein